MLYAHGNHVEKNQDENGNLKSEKKEIVWLKYSQICFLGPKTGLFTFSTKLIAREKIGGKFKTFLKHEKSPKKVSWEMRLFLGEIPNVYNVKKGDISRDFGSG